MYVPGLTNHICCYANAYFGSFLAIQQTRCIFEHFSKTKSCLFECLAFFILEIEIGNQENRNNNTENFSKTKSCLFECLYLISGDFSAVGIEIGKQDNINNNTEKDIC